MLQEKIEQARYELVRAEHSLFVTLKFVKSSEVFKIVLLRIISSYQQLIEFLIENKNLEEPYIEEKLKSAYAEDIMIKQIIEDYLYLKFLDLENAETVNELTKRVALIVNFGDDTRFVIDILVIKEYYQKAWDTINFIENYFGK